MTGNFAQLLLSDTKSASARKVGPKELDNIKFYKEYAKGIENLPQV
jgi:hypothetical protein